ncbi:MAG: DNA repair protein RecO [Candidatus Omnitrophota bacterium]
MSIHKAQSLVISKRDFRETSFIVNFYTKEFGKISGLMKGIRTEPAKFASTVEPFSFNEIVFYSKHSTSLHLVSACDSINNFNIIRKDISRIGMASMMMELIDAVMQPEDAHPDIFNLSLDCLQELEVNNNPEKIMAIFKIKLLILSGFKPHFDSCVSCSARIIGQGKFSLLRGGLLCERCYGKDMSARSIFRGTIASVLHIERNDLRNNLNLGLNPQIKRELDMILNSFINFHLEKELKSQKVISKMENFVPVGVK